MRKGGRSTAAAVAPLVVLLVALTAGCAAVRPAERPVESAPADSPAEVSTPAPLASPQPLMPRPRGTVTGVLSAAGVRQWVHCQGRGPVTLVVIPGLGATAQSWSRVLPALQSRTRTCIYDRPGLGLSPPRPSPGQVVDAGIYARELSGLLSAAGERGPLVVLGHSYGGLIARAFLRASPARVSGVLLAESDTPGDPTTGRYWVEAGHRVDMRAGSVAAGGGPPMGHLPLLVLSASNPEGDHLGGPTYGQPRWMIDLWRAQQRKDRALSTDAVQVIARSGHVLQQDDPRALIESVRVLLAAVESGEQLRCTSAWKAFSATCR